MSSIVWQKVSPLVGVLLRPANKTYPRRVAGEMFRIFFIFKKVTKKRKVDTMRVAMDVHRAPPGHHWFTKASRLKQGRRYIMASIRLFVRSFCGVVFPTLAFHWRSLFPSTIYDVFATFSRDTPLYPPLGAHSCRSLRCRCHLSACPSWCVLVRLGVSLCDLVCPCVSLCDLVCLCTSLCDLVCLCTSLCDLVCLCVSLCVCVCVFVCLGPPKLGSESCCSCS